MVSPSDNFFFAESINFIKAKDWNECVGLDHPFTRFEFLSSLESSQSAAPHPSPGPQSRDGYAASRQ